jgi:antitoxin Phd
MELNNLTSQTSQEECMRKTWQIQEAKSKFSEVVDRALEEGVQVVTRRGKKAVVVMPYEEYERLTQRGGSLVSFLSNSPLAGSELKVERDRSLPRSIDIEP